MIDMQGQVAVIFGVANKRSIAYSVAETFAKAGATLVLGYQSERLRKDSEQLLAELGQENRGKLVQCDVSKDAEIDAAFAQIREAFPAIHTVVHSIGFAPNIKNAVLDTTREDFAVAHDISVYSLIAMARAAVPLMTEGGSLLTLTYYGSEKVFPNYNIMGVAKAALEALVRYLAFELGPKNIRVNAVSAGPIKTLAARGIGVVYGGASIGLMGALADSALAAGGEVIGVIPGDLFPAELPHAGLTEQHVVKTMHERKALMAELSDAVIALPGGTGTLDVDGYWQPLLTFMDHMAHERFITAEHRATLLVESDATALLERLGSFQPTRAGKWLDADGRPAVGRGE